MKTKQKANKYLVQNKNFLNNQNYIVGNYIKTEVYKWKFKKNYIFIFLYIIFFGPIIFLSIILLITSYLIEKFFKYDLLLSIRNMIKKVKLFLFDYDEGGGEKYIILRKKIDDNLFFSDFIFIKKSEKSHLYKLLKKKT